MTLVFDNLNVIQINCQKDLALDLEIPRERIWKS